MTQRRCSRIHTALWFVAPLVAACGGGDQRAREGAPPSDATAVPSTGPYAVRVILGNGSERKIVRFYPAPEVSGEGEVEQGSAGNQSTSSHPQTVVGTPAGELDIGELESQNGWSKGWGLLAGAAAECGLGTSAENNSLLFTPVSIQPWDPVGGTSHPDYPTEYAGAGGPSAWFVFGGRRTANGELVMLSCQDQIAHQEALLCMADKLAEAADTVKPIVWTGPERYVNSAIWGPLATTWTIPPQPDTSKFVLRDHAINVLAHLARLTQEKFSGATFTEATCQEALTHAATDQSYAANHKASLFGAINDGFPYPAYLPRAILDTTVDGQRVAAGYLQFETQILRGASRLLKKLIEDSVAADAAGAEVQRARAGDPKRGAELFWGVRTQGGAPPYNSLAHGFRVLHGRWESGNPNWAVTPVDNARLPSGDPQCAGTLPLDLLAGAGKAQFEPRWNDRKVTSPGQEFAAKLFSNAGLVIPKAETGDSVGVYLARIALTEQLQLDAARSAGVDVTQTSELDAFKASDQGKSIEIALQGIADEDIKFGADRTFDAYRLLTGAPADATVTELSPGEGVAGLALRDQSDRTLVPELVNTLGGATLPGAFPREDAAVDPMARSALAAAASQCPEYVPDANLAGSADYSKVSSFQNSFTLAQTFRARLSAIRERTHLALGSVSGDLKDELERDVIRVANRASAEIRAWAGPGEAWMARAGGFPSEFPNYFDVRLVGLTEDEIRAESGEGASDNFRVVFGEPWVAECAAGLRRSCPTNFAADYEQVAWYEIIGAPSVPGADGRVVHLRFNETSNAPPKFQPTPTPVGEAPTKLLYLIQKRDPEQLDQGKILAGFAVRPEKDSWLVEAVSDYRAELNSSLVGMPERWPWHGLEQGERGGESNQDYCGGVPRDLFVPLENELTSDGDGFETSWRHYLSLADQAAERADSLGKELIDLGLQRDLRREGAGEELAERCGLFGALDDLKVENGIVQPRETQDKSLPAELQACLDEAKIDVVFLTNDPVDTHPGALDLALGCNTPTPDPKCGAEVSHAGLSLTGYEEGGLPPAECESAIKLVESYEHGKIFGPSITDVSAQTWASSSELGAVLQSSQLVVQDNGDWSLSFGSRKLMSSALTDETTHWPACLGATGGCATLASEDAAVATALERIFGDDVLDNGNASKAVGRDRVARTIWWLGLLSGGMPSNRIQMPFPVRDFDSTPSWGAPSITVFGTSQWDGDPSTYYLLREVYEPGGRTIVSDRDREVLGKALRIDKIGNAGYYLGEIGLLCRIRADSSSFRAAPDTVLAA